ncbi:serine/threonine protein kinase, partial [Streptomyces sp. SID14478]|nr:serine/threonine protein kinase [Streptomyces sp. SID14478]
VPMPRTQPPATDVPQDGAPGRFSVSVSATSAPTTADGRGRKVSCSVALAVAGALAAVTVGGILVVNMLPGDSGSDSGAADGSRPPQATVSSAPSGPGVPKFYVGAWDGPAVQAGIPFGTFRVDLAQAAVGKQVGKVTSTDPLGVQCVDVLTLKSADGKELVAAGKAAADNGDTCAKGTHTVHLTRDGDSLKYTSQYPQAGNPTADLDRVPAG